MAERTARGHGTDGGVKNGTPTRLVWLGIGLPIVLTRTAQLVAVGVCNNSGGKFSLPNCCPPLYSSTYPHLHYYPYLYPLLIASIDTLFHLVSGTIVNIDLDPREVVNNDNSGSYRVVHLVYPPTRVVIFMQSAYDAGLHTPPFNRGEIVVGVESRTFKRAQLHLLPGHLSSVYRAQVRLPENPRLLFLIHYFIRHF